MRKVSTLLLCLLLAGCSQQVVFNRLDEAAANEMVAALRQSGITAEKAQKDAAYAVTVPDGDFARAVQVLQALGLPRVEFDSLGKVFKREGFVSTPLEERARLVHALSQELSHTVSSIDGVLLARVTLVMPDKHPLSDKYTPSSAAVLIKHRPGLDIDAMVPKVKALVVNSVEGLPYEGVTVVAFPAESRQMPEALPAHNAATLGTPLLAIGALGVAALAGAAVMWRRKTGGPSSLAPRATGLRALRPRSATGTASAPVTEGEAPT